MCPMAMWPGSFSQHLVGEDLRHQPHALDVGKMLTVGGGNARRLLAAMLQGVESEIRLARGIRMPVNGDHAALFAELADRVAHGAARTAGGGRAAITLQCCISDLRCVNSPATPCRATAVMPSPRCGVAASRAEAQGVRSSEIGAEINGSP